MTIPQHIWSIGPDLSPGVHAPMLLNAAKTIEKLLRGAEGRLVKLLGALDELEANAKFIVQGISVVADDL